MKKKILILVSILVVFLAIPPFVNYWVSTPSPIGFIPIEKQEVWISFYASLIGSGITLLGVQIPLHRITDSASNGSVFPVVTEHFSASSDHAFL